MTFEHSLVQLYPRFMCSGGFCVSGPGVLVLELVFMFETCVSFINVWSYF